MKKKLEIEFKYNAADIPLEEFKTYAEALSPVKFVAASGWDHFYDRPKDDSGFYRYRIGPNFAQLTYKRKLHDKNNYIRTEHNINCALDTSEQDITALLAESGYQPNTKLFKNCFIYHYTDFTLVYYVIYDANLRERGRFVEIELSESKDWGSEDKAWAYLTSLEADAKVLGVTPQARIKRSLWEMFKK